MMKKLIVTLIAGAAVFTASASATSKAYGVQIFSSTEASAQPITPKIVSFNIDAPNTIDTELVLTGMNIRGAACDGATYYLVQSDDGLVSSSWWALDMSIQRLTKIADYPMGTLENSLLISDMTYDPTTKNIYAIAFDLANAVVGDDDSIDAPFGLFKIDPATGATSLVGYQDFMAFATLAAGADGNLWGVDTEGSLWEINKNNGRPIDSYASSGISASGMQSMSFDMKSGELYWATCDGWEETCTFSKFTFMPDMVMYSLIAPFDNANEIIGLYIDSDPIAADSPACVTDFTATPAPDGEGKAYLTWTNPTTTTSGASLSQSIDIIIKRSSKEIARLSGLTPGEKCSYTDTDVPNGLYDYCLLPVNASGEGEEAYALDVFVGIDTPDAVSNLTAVKAAASYAITVSWDAPTKGLNNGWFDAASLAYDVVRLPDDKIIATGITQTTVTDESISQLEGYSYRVTPTSAHGNGPSAVSPVVVSGPALSLPQTFDFSTDNQRRLWASIPNSFGNIWEGYCFSSVNLWCMRYFPDEIAPSAEDASWIVSPPVVMDKDRHYRLSYDLRTYGNLAPTDLTVKYGTTSNPQEMANTLCDITDFDPDGMVFKNYSYDFIATESGVNYIGIGIKNLVPAWLSNVTITPVEANDLAVVRLEGSPVSNQGTPSTFTVTVRNVGYEPISESKVTLVDAAGNMLAEGVYAKTLKPLATAKLTLTWTPEATGTITIYAKCADDSNNANNTSEAYTIDVLDPGYWHIVRNGSLETAVSPTYLAYPHSYTQALYTASEIASAPGHIDGIMYYYYCYGNRTVQPFDIKVYLSNTSASMLDISAPVEASDFTLAYEGTVTVDPYGSMLPLIFDKSFEYTGGNLVVAVAQTNDSPTTDLRYYCGYGENFDGRTIYYRGDEPYSGTMSDSLQELANIALLMDTPSDDSGITSADITKVVSSEYYTLSGIKLMSPAPGLNIRIDTYADGSHHASKVIVK